MCYICSPTRLFNFFNGYRNYLGFLLLEFILFYFSKYVTFFSFPPGSSLILFYCLSCDSDIVDLQRCACFSCTTPWIGYCKHIYPLSWTSLPPSPPPRPGHHRAAGSAGCAVWQLPASCLFYTRSCIYFSVTLSSASHSVHKSILYVGISIPALKIASSAPLFSGSHNVLIYDYLFFFFLTM